MLILLYSLQFVFGASLGSFYITTAERILLYFYGKKRKEGSFGNRMFSLLIKPSHCNHCEEKIPSYLLLPVVGFFLSKGKCFHCKTKLPWIYPGSEFLFGAITVLSFYATDSVAFSVFFTFFLGHLIISIQTDANYFSLDYENLPFLLIFGSLSNYFITETLPGWEDLYVLIGFAAFYFLLYKLVKQGMGLADVIFAPAFAFIAGHPFWILFLNSSYVLATVVTILSRKKGESLRGKMIPMGVYFSLGIFFTFMAKVLYYRLGIEGVFSDDIE
ncbi:prepilin peptidase [Leptospira idonii]|uniref:Prepilin peptidase n=1 Tax=Leptospira idonii TaxID=1193500 RepID=A0A4R9M2F7_9LEPT|nr:A24 family peptidase [Leptospira idonii]TGN20055.1 prepilin peptidase [Leptospira idonii]